MKKILIILVLATGLIISGSVSYFLLFTFPKIKKQELTKKENEQLLSRQIECQKNGLIFHEKRLENSSLKEYTSRPELKFNKKLNTCLYKIKFFKEEENSSTTFETIQDVYTNSNLISYHYTIENGEKIKKSSTTPEEFKEKEIELFNE